MEERYDAIVIGAGLGGLSSATYLASKGQRVLVLERHNVPGGYATSFVRGRFEFEIALHELSGLGTKEKPGGLYRYLDSLGVTEHLEFVQAPNLYRSIFPGLDLTLPPGREEYTQTLVDAFPGQERGIRRFIDRIFDLFKETLRLASMSPTRMKSPLGLAQLPLRFPNATRYSFATWGEVLERDVKDPEARAVISQYWGYFGLPPSKVSYLYFATGLASYIHFGASFPKGRSQMLSSAFVSRIEELGSEIRFNVGAAKIAVEDGRVAGVLTDDGAYVKSDVVVSNADPITTCRELVDAENVRPGFFDRLRSTRVAPSTVNCYLGLAAPAEAVGLTDHEVFVNRDFDQEAHGAAMETLDPPPCVVMTAYNTVMPEVSPPGTSIVVLTSLYYGDPWLAIPPDEYVSVKQRIAAGMLDRIAPVAPGLRDAIEEIEVSTPLTNMRYAGTMGGSIYGFDNTPAENTVWRIPHRGPVRGLWFVGAWTQPGGGFEPTMISGKLAGEAIVRRAG